MNNLEKIKNDHGNGFVNIAVNNNIESKKNIAIKDIHSTTNFPTTVCSKILETYQAPFNSTVVENLLKNNFNIIGTTNMDEFAMGSTTRTSIYGPTDNAYDVDKIPGGSSGGSAYVVGKGLVDYATGTDTGGSVRQPAAYNGIYGMKPTYGLISRYGTVSFASSFDTIGPMTKTLEQNIELLNCLISNDEKDQTNFVPENFDLKKSFNEKISGMKIGLMVDWLNEIDGEIKTAILTQVEKLKKLGAEIIEIKIPSTKYSFELYMVLAYSEASSNLARYDGFRYGYYHENNTYKKTRTLFGEEVKKRLIIGSYFLSSENALKYFDKALKLRKKMENDFLEKFNEVSVIIGPTTPNLPFNKNENMNSKENYLSDEFVIPANLVGFPALNIPIGLTKNNLPIGMQIMSWKYNEHLIYQVANNLKGDNNE